MPRPRTPATLAGRLRRRWPWGSVAPQPPAHLPEDPLLQAGRMLRERREARGLNLRQLAALTRISTPVLEALERGWRDRLPEPTYLRTMLPLLEQHLELAPGSLLAVLPLQSAEHGRGAGRQPLLARFTPGSIDVFTTWQGTVLYGVLTLGLIYAVNLQQQRLAAANLLTLRPIPPLPAAAQESPPDPNAALLEAYPDLRPLQQAAAGVARGRLQEVGRANTDQAGVLLLRLEQPTRVLLRTDTGARTTLQGVSGELVLPLQPPLELELEPAPPAAGVLWNGKPLETDRGQPGRYRVASRAAAAAAAPRP